jgi:hypothetical protein
MLKVPIEARFSATAGKVKASVGATGTADFGVQAMVMPTDVDLAVIGDGVSFAPNNQYFDFDAGVSAEVEARLVTGVSLSAMFGWSEPLAAKVGTGVRGTFTYATVSSSGAVPFDASCVQAVMEKVQDFTISAKFFGLRKSKVTVEKAIEFLRSKRPSHCTVAEHAVNVNASWRPAFNGDARTGAVTRLELATLDGGSPVQPGAVLEVETRGAYYFGASTQTANNGAGVFASGTGALLAAAAGSTAGPATTALDCASGPDPVAEDFSIPFGGSATVVVPQGASALLIGVDDCVFADNAHVSAQDLVRIRLSVLSNPPARAD